MYSVGPGLLDLVNCPEVQHHIYGTTAKELAFEKAIYKHGALRKVNICSYLLYPLRIENPSGFVYNFSCQEY